MSSGTPTPPNGNHEQENRPTDNGSHAEPDLSSVPPFFRALYPPAPDSLDIAEVETTHMSTPDLQRSIAATRREEAQRHQARARALRDLAAGLDDDVKRTDAMIRQLGGRLSELHTVPEGERGEIERNEIEILTNLLLDQCRLRGWLAADRQHLQSLALEHRRAAQWLRRDTGI